MTKKTWGLHAPIYKRAMKADQKNYDFMYDRRSLSAKRWLHGSPCCMRSAVKTECGTNDIYEIIAGLPEFEKADRFKATITTTGYS